MTLILQGTTKTKDLIIDYIEVQLSSGKTVSLNWDESGIDRTPEGFDAKYKGVYFDEKYANGRLDELRGMQVVDLGLYSESESTASLIIDEMVFTFYTQSIDIKPCILRSYSCCFSFMIHRNTDDKHPCFCRQSQYNCCGNLFFQKD